tara:strand:+ start:90 stop:449 length:360 start_codon:yes stop_codon:yes gene_type:complete
MISEETKEKINYDFKDIDNLINDNDHIVRKYYIEFLNGNYGKDIYNKYFNLYVRANNKEKKLRALAIQSFIEYNSIDYGLSYNQIRYYLKRHIGLDNLEKLNIELIKDIKIVYNLRGAE